MAVKNKMHINELNSTFFKENYKIKKNVTEVELMETIENLSDDSTSNNESYDDNNSKKITEKTNEKLKKNNNKNKSDENKERKIYHSNIPQIYETYESNVKDEFQMANNNENQETSIISNVIAVLYIIIAVGKYLCGFMSIYLCVQLFILFCGVYKNMLHFILSKFYILIHTHVFFYIFIFTHFFSVILLHMHLNEDHIIIKTISTLKLKYVDLIKSVPIFSNLMNTV